MDEHTVIVPILSFRYPDNHVTEKLGLCEQFWKENVCEKYLYIGGSKNLLCWQQVATYQCDADVYNTYQ